MNAMDRIGELRSALAGGDFEGVDTQLLLAREEPGFQDLLRYARGRDTKALSPERVAHNAKWTSPLGGHPSLSLFHIASERWTVSYGETPIASSKGFDVPLYGARWVAEFLADADEHWIARAVARWAAAREVDGPDAASDDRLRLLPLEGAEGSRADLIRAARSLPKHHISGVRVIIDRVTNPDGAQRHTYCEGYHRPFTEHVIRALAASEGWA